MFVVSEVMSFVVVVVGGCVTSMIVGGVEFCRECVARVVFMCVVVIGGIETVSLPLSSCVFISPSSSSNRSQHTSSSSSFPSSFSFFSRITPSSTTTFCSSSSSVDSFVGLSSSRESPFPIGEKVSSGESLRSTGARSCGCG